MITNASEFRVALPYLLRHPINDVMQHSRSLHRFADFSCLRGAALTISPGHMVRALDLNSGPLFRCK